MLKGYKTYIMAGVTAIGAIAAYLVGDLNVAAAVQLVVTAVMGAFIRDGINTAASK